MTIKLTKKQREIIARLNEFFQEAKKNGIGIYFDYDYKKVYAYNEKKHARANFDGAERIDGGIDEAEISTYDE